VRRPRACAEGGSNVKPPDDRAGGPRSNGSSPVSSSLARGRREWVGKTRMRMRSPHPRLARRRHECERPQYYLCAGDRCGNRNVDSSRETPHGGTSAGGVMGGDEGECSIPGHDSPVKSVPHGGQDRYIKKLPIAWTTSLPRAGEDPGGRIPGMPAPAADHRSSRGAAGSVKRGDLDARGNGRE
jgi:hypothetical protein